MRRLTNRQLQFIQEYLIDLNAARAAVRAGYSGRTARQAGAENLSKPVIADEINKRMRAIADRNEMTVAKYIKNLEERINADVSDIFDSNGSLLPPDQWPSIWRRGLVTVSGSRRRRRMGS